MSPLYGPLVGIYSIKFFPAQFTMHAALPPCPTVGSILKPPVVLQSLLYNLYYSL